MNPTKNSGEKEDSSRFGQFNFFKGNYDNLRKEISEQNFELILENNESLTVCLEKFYDETVKCCKKANFPQRKTCKSKIPFKVRKLFKRRTIFLKKLKSEKQKVVNYANKKIKEIDTELKESLEIDNKKAEDEAIEQTKTNPKKFNDV